MNTEQLKEVVEKALPKGGDIMLSLAEKWKEEGYEEGIEQGKKQGIEQGKKQGIKQAERRMFLHLLEARFGAVPVELVLRTEKLLTEQLKRLFDLAINATSLDEIEQAMALLVKASKSAHLGGCFFVDRVGDSTIPSLKSSTSERKLNEHEL